MPDAPSSVHLSVASSSSLQVNFWEPLSINSAVVTKYKGKDQDPCSRAVPHSYGRCLAPLAPHVNTIEPWAVLPSLSWATFMLECRRNWGCWTPWPPPKCSELDQASSLQQGKTWGIICWLPPHPAHWEDHCPAPLTHLNQIFLGSGRISSIPRF